MCYRCRSWGAGSLFKRVTSSRTSRVPHLHTTHHTPAADCAPACPRTHSATAHTHTNKNRAGRAPAALPGQLAPNPTTTTPSAWQRPAPPPPPRTPTVPPLPPLRAPLHALLWRRSQLRRSGQWPQRRAAVRGVCVFEWSRGRFCVCVCKRVCRRGRERGLLRAAWHHVSSCTTACS
jgi:hypothetical protein